MLRFWVSLCVEDRREVVEPQLAPFQAWVVLVVQRDSERVQVTGQRILCLRVLLLEFCACSR
jgi:hypothetical protein